MGYEIGGEFAGRTMPDVIVIATAGWSIPRAWTRHFPEDGTQLQRYAQVLRGVEIDTSFHRDHAEKTYKRWAAQTPRAFRFAVKLPRAITHEGQLRAARRPLVSFLESVAGLGRGLGPLIVQLPPSLSFEPRVARNFFALLRDLHEGPVACEPRHASWFDDRAGRLLVSHRIARIAADPAVVPAAAQPGGWSGLMYFRLHGSPRRYWSAYLPEQLAAVAAVLARAGRGTQAWCVLDNTASGAAMGNALQMPGILEEAALVGGLPGKKWCRK